MIPNNSIIDDAYNRLSNAYYYKRDRKAIEESCKYCQSLGIPNFQELANAEMTKLYSYRRIKTYPVRTSIECLPSDVLGMYAMACMDVLFNMKIANPILWALQGIDDTLNNKSKTELTNHSLHIATDFLASSVKESLTDTNTKRNVAVSALMVNLAIDFLVKDNQ